MQIFDEIVPHDNPIYEKAPLFFVPEETLMFDIETTGLSPASSFIYIIGINYYTCGDWHITLLFNDDGRSEPEIIGHFMEILPKYKNLIEFNGDAFDIPFVKKRLEYINRRLGKNIPDNLEGITKLDLYKMIRPFKTALGLSNLKQKTIERFVGINRIDQMNGGELINVYFNYLGDRSQKLRTLLLQHNRDDMEGMFYLIEIFALKKLDTGSFSVSSIEMSGSVNLRIKFNLAPDCFPKLSLASSLRDKTKSMSESSVTAPLLIISAEEKKAYLSFPVSFGCFKYYYKDYKNYNYYPELDTAYPKSLAENYKEMICEPAKASNCYTRLEGFFIPKYKFSEGRSFFPDEAPLSSKSLPYLELSDDFLGDKALLDSFAQYMVSMILHQ